MLTFYAIQNGYGQMLTDMGLGDEVERIRSAYSSDGFGAAREQVPDEMLDRVPMFAGSSLDGLTERLEEYEEAGATRMIVAYVPSGDDLWGEIQHFLDTADFVGAAPSEMDFQLTDDQEAIRKAVGRDLRPLPRPVLARGRRRGRLPGRVRRAR